MSPTRATASSLTSSAASSPTPRGGARLRPPPPPAPAERYGLVTGVTTADELEETALKFARRLAAGAPLAVRYTKAAVNQYVKQVATTTFDYSMGLELLTFVSEDHREALAAIKEKRKPSFQGK